MTTLTEITNSAASGQPTSKMDIYKAKPARSRRSRTTSTSVPTESDMKDQPAVKRTRASVPRPRSGCQTCKRRHVKCDETKPECQKCAQTGRKCDGYSVAQTKGASRLSALASTLSIASYEIPFKIPGSQNDRRIFHYFCVHAAADLGKGSLPSFWNSLILQCSQDEPVVRSALLALSYEHLDFVTRDPDDSRFGLGMESASVDGLQQHHKAVRQLRKYIATNRRPSVKAVLICCLLFYYFESSRGEHQTALLHLRNGLAILRSEHHAFESFQNPTAPESDTDLAQLVTVFGIVDCHVSLFDYARLPELELMTGEEKLGQVNISGPPGTAYEFYDPNSPARIKLLNWAVHFMITNQHFKYSDVQHVPPIVLAEKQALEGQLVQLLETANSFHAAVNAEKSLETQEEAALKTTEFKLYNTMLLLSVQASIATDGSLFRAPTAYNTAAVDHLAELVNAVSAGRPPSVAPTAGSRRGSGEAGESSEQELNAQGNHLKPPTAGRFSRSASPSPLPDSMFRHRSFNAHGLGLLSWIVLASKTTSTELRERMIELTAQCSNRREGPFSGGIIAKVLKTLQSMEDQCRHTLQAGGAGAEGEDDGSSSEEEEASSDNSSDSDSDSANTMQRVTRDYANQMLEGRPFCAVAACLSRGSHGERCCWCEELRPAADGTGSLSLEDVGAMVFGGVNGFERLLQSRLPGTRKRS